MSREINGACEMEEVFARRSGRSTSWKSDETGNDEMLHSAAIEKLLTYDRLRIGLLKRIVKDEDEDRRRKRYEHKKDYNPKYPSNPKIRTLDHQSDRKNSNFQSTGGDSRPKAFSPASPLAFFDLKSSPNPRSFSCSPI